MAVFTKVTDGEVAAFLDAYGIPAPDAVSGISEGIENTNYKILAGGARYILTLYESRVAIEDLPYFLALMDAVADAGLPAARPVATTKGDRLMALNGRPAALIEFLPGRPSMAPSPDDARQAGAILARFHQATADLKLHRPNSMGPASWAAMAKRAGDRLDQFDQGLAAETQQTLLSLRERWPRHLPRGPIHADLFPDNLLLDHGEVSGVIDFYFACTDFFAYDLAISMNAYTSETGDVDLANAVALRQGYETVRPLSQEERNALPVLLTGCAMRFFLTRATDAIFVPDSDMYTGKDPLPWLRLLRHHQKATEPN